MKGDCSKCSKSQQAACKRIGSRKKVHIGSLDVTEVDVEALKEWVRT